MKQRTSTEVLKILRPRTERVNYLDYLDCSKVMNFFSKRLHFSSFEKALIDTSNLSISFVPIEFVIFFVKIRFLNFKILFETLKCLNLFKSYEFFSKCLYFWEMNVFITKNKIFVQIFCSLYDVLLKEKCSKVYRNFTRVFY